MSQFVAWKDVRKRLQMDEKQARILSRRTQALLDGVKLAELRQVKRLTQAQMAKKLKIDQSNVSRIERGSFDAIEVRSGAEGEVRPFGAGRSWRELASGSSWWPASWQRSLAG